MRNMYSFMKMGGNNCGYKILFWFYIAIIFRITVFRSGFGFEHLFQNGNINFTLFCDYIPLIREGHWYMFMYLFVGNIIWFIPFGFYLRYIGKPKGILRITICGFFLSLTIETLQYVFGTGYSELDDLVLNTFGVWIGAISGRWFRCCAQLQKNPCKKGVISDEQV